MLRGRSLFASLTLLASAAGALAGPGDFFGLRVVDEATGRGVPMVTLETTNGIRLVADNSGWAAFLEPGLMDRKVFFTVTSPGYAMPKEGFGFAGAGIQVEPGGTAEIKIMRLNIAERMYRVTGQGLYRDATLLGREAPLPSPNLFSDVMGQDSVQALPYRGKLFWMWGDTLRAAHPLGNFHTTCATSELPDQGGLHPSLGVHLKYFLNEKGDTVRRMMPTTEPGMMWLDGLVTVPGPDGTEVLLAHYSRMKDLGTRLEHGIAEFNDEAGIFEPLIRLGEEFKWQCPRGHAERVKDGEIEYFYFADPFCHTRVRADYESLLNPAGYESLVWSGEAYEWQSRVAPTSQEEETKLVKEKKIPAAKALYQVRNASGGKPVLIHGGTVRWNEHRKRWIMIAVEHRGDESLLGEVWYAEAPAVSGPWGPAVKIASHPKMSFYNPCQHGFFDQDGGKTIYFEGTYTHTFSGNPEVTPRYEYNQLMYRLDVTDRRLAAAQK